MKVLSTLIVITAFALGSLFANTTADIAGNWNILVNAPGMQVGVGLSLTQKDDTFTGTSTSEIGNGTIEQGKVNGNEFTALLKGTMQGNPIDIKLSGKIDGDKITGSMDFPGLGSLPFNGVRKK